MRPRESTAAVGSLDEQLDLRLSALPDPAAAIAALEQELRTRRIFFGGEKIIPTFLRPHLLDAELHDPAVAESEAFFRLIERVAQRVVTDEALARWLGFEEGVRELFRIDPGYPTLVVIARPDAVFENGALRLIEVNCDSPAMMTFADEVEEILRARPPLDALAHQLPPPRRVEALLLALLGCHAARGGGKSPTVAIVDWPGEKTAYELQKTAERFTTLGTESFVAAPNELRYERGRLSARGRAIDLVYRRILFRDFLHRGEELAPLLAAYRDGAITLCNPLASSAVGTKAVLALLHDDDNPADLTPADKLLVDRLIPKTVLQVGPPPPLEEQARWVLKKAESHGGQDVVLGPLVDAATWKSTLSGTSKERWIRQLVVNVPTFHVPALRGRQLRFEPKYLNWNPLFFGGRYGGAIARVSDSMLINISLGGGLLPSIRSF